MSVNGVLRITVVKIAWCKTEIMQMQNKVCSKFYSRKYFTDLYLSAKDIYGKYGVNFSTECWIVDVRDT